MENETQFDVIVIGSGMGGLTTASLLAKLGNKKVLVLERHFKIGGFTHVFKREGKYLWDVGVHYVGDMDEAAVPGKIFNLITDGKLKWNKMKDPFEKFIYPNLTFSVRGDEKQYIADLCKLFPEEEEAIRNYFHDVKSVSGWFARNFTIKALPPILSGPASLIKMLGQGDALITTKEYLDKNFKRQELKAILASQWGDFGLPPSKSAFAIHALIVTHYLNGAYYPEGSSMKIAETIKPVVESKGGVFKINSEVVEILTRDNSAVGVRVKEVKGKETIETEYFAPTVISDAGAYTTYCKLLPKYNFSFKEELRTMDPGLSNVTLYLGLKESPAKLGIHGENHWIYPSFDHEENYQNRNQLLDGKPNGCYVSFPSLKDPQASYHTAEIISFVDYKPFEQWKDNEWKNRGEDYKALKNKIADSLIDYADKHIPGFKDLIEFKELSTPISNEYFTGHRNGTIYGIPCTPDRFTKEWLSVRSPIQNLYMTGADIGSPGIAGAMMGGVITAATVLGFSGILGVIKEASK